jgi:outer membrane protein TolC
VFAKTYLFDTSTNGAVSENTRAGLSFYPKGGTLSIEDAKAQLDEARQNYLKAHAEYEKARVKFDEEAEQDIRLRRTGGIEYR